MSKNKDREKQLNIGVLIGNVHKYHPKELIQGIYQGAGDYQVNVLFFLGTQRTTKESLLHDYDNSENDSYRLNIIYDYADLSGLDALIVSYGTIGVHMNAEEKERLWKIVSGYPHIVMEDVAEQDSYIISDNIGGMFKIMEHLIDVHKYTRIAFIGGPRGNTDALQREQVYFEMMKKHGLEVRDDYIRYGDYSLQSGKIAGEILDAHPEIQAIVCANDEMALGAYEECKKRGLNIGEDIAITGYDNSQSSQTADPPLTTVNQNGYDMGYRAIKELIKICNGNYQTAVKVPTELCRRNSCGCFVGKKYKKSELQSPEDILNGMDEVVDRITSACVMNMENEAMVVYVRQYVKETLNYFISSFLENEDGKELDFDKDYLKHILKKIVNSKYWRLISVKALLDELSSALMLFMTDKLMPEKRLNLLVAITTAQEYLNANMRRQQLAEYNDLKNKASMSPYFERKLMECVLDEKQVYFESVRQLKFLGVKGVYICVNREPVVYHKGCEWKKPEELYVAAYLNNESIMAFEENERMKIDSQFGLLKVHNNCNGQRYMAFSLYSDEYQYGLLVCNIEPGDVTTVSVYSLMLGSVLRFMHTSKMERQVKKKLEDSMRLLQEKNKVLGFISAYDELTGMLNRRGFGEKAFEFTKRFDGKKAYFVFADLDHLKEINDTFGHPEGDFAIIECARILNSQCGTEDLVGRMGGDEFMMMISSDAEDFETEFKQNVKKAFEELNSNSGKPFYVEASIGVKPFLCNSTFELSSVLQQADKVMYESKKARRNTISRD